MLPSDITARTDAPAVEPLFCVHMLGPDDVYPAPDRITAFRWAAAMNSAALPFNQDADDSTYVICHANVEIYDGTPEQHAAGLPHAIEQMTPRRGPIPSGQVVEIDYTNHEGKRAVRKVKPTGRMLVGLDRYHPDAPWLIEARDVERNVMRTFDPAKIHRWGAAALAPDPSAAGVAVPEGYALVPVEPTQEMLDAGEKAEWEAVFTGDYYDPDPEDVSRESCRNGASVAYRAMIAAAPKPRAAPAGEETAYHRAGADRDPPPSRAVAFGVGKMVVETGTFHGQAAVFIAPAREGGPVGTEVSEADMTSLDALDANETVWTFPTIEQARAVADALCGQSYPSAYTEKLRREDSATPAQGAGVDLAGVEALVSELVGTALVECGGYEGPHGTRTKNAEVAVLDAVRALLRPAGEIAGLVDAYEWSIVNVDAVSTRYISEHYTAERQALDLKTALVRRDAARAALDAVIAAFQRDAAISRRTAGPESGDGDDPFASIAKWCEDTFGPITVERLVSRAAEEMDELRAEPHKADEVADVIINLSRYPGAWAAVQAKMEVNRGRKWRLVGDGTGYHVKADGSTSAPKADVQGVPFAHLVAQLEYAVDAQVIAGERGTRNDWIDATEQQEAARNRLLAHTEGRGPAHTAAALDVLSERRRQVEGEGWTPKHDDGHDLGELGLAAALYALPYDADVGGGEKLIKQDDFIGLDMALLITCGWDLKPETDARKRLVKAGALILAEIERRDRVRSRISAEDRTSLADGATGGEEK